ncbi:unconventional prefoldin RPB5 interactor 1 [Achroia grisella]|uniref:unconventional prefoldin RPB5 interactor 1 n=1 Tax=Achroia grisella TaxID=688607 RepID=UPI0027D205DA|nr:unconventional prefoldin RPB5 interactor 1 [Achroia grisella]
MSILKGNVNSDGFHFFHKYINENDKNLQFWDDYLHKLKSLDFNVYSDKLTVPILVPIGNKILFRGHLKHTNEVTVSLGADYFTKCSLKQAEVLRQHRIEDAQSKVEMFTKEKEYLESQISFKNNMTEHLGQEIIEVHTDEEDKAWREKHRENVKKYKKQNQTHKQTTSDITDEELWVRLEELELQEELENEMLHMDNRKYNKDSPNTIIREIEESNISLTEKTELKENKDETVSNKIMNDPKPVLEQTSKLNILQQVIDKQNELEQKLTELKYKERSETKTEQDLIARLDEMDELDDLEDEMNRLEDNILETNALESEEDNDAIAKSSTSIRKGVSFADEDDSETVDIVFKHSTVEPCKEPYNPDNGLKKPSDIYYACPNLFNETTSILKKSKYESNIDYTGDTGKSVIGMSIPESNKIPINKTIIVKDVVEKSNQCDNKIEIENRPTSLFKKKRLQNKS